MYNYLFILLTVFLLHSCAEENQRDVTHKNTKSIPRTEKKSHTDNGVVIKKEKNGFRITNNNLYDFFTKYGKDNPETILRLSCKFGDIDIRLYRNTPLHRADIVYLTKRGYFDLTQFYRVSKEFVVQAGNSDEWDCQEMRAKIGSFVLPAEFRKKNIHKYGAVSMARRYDKNPKKKSSPYEFFIVLGRKYTRAEIHAHEREFGTKYTEEQCQIYESIGGTPFLDMQHTVIGEVVSGMDVVHKINGVTVDNREWPLIEIPIKMKVIK